jgi:hypothetical protein
MFDIKVNGFLYGNCYDGFNLNKFNERCKKEASHFHRRLIIYIESINLLWQAIIP